MKGEIRSNKGSEERDEDSKMERKRVSETDGDEREILYERERALGHWQGAYKETKTEQGQWERGNEEREIKQIKEKGGVVLCMKE